MPAGVWIKQRFNLPMLSEVNAPIFSERNKYHGISLQALARWSEAYVWRNADKVLPVTEVLAGYVQAVGVTRDRIEVIPNGIDLYKFKNIPDSDSAKARLGLSGKRVLGFTGFMREWHGLERVVDFIHARRDDNLHLLLVGDGPARHSLEARALQLGVSERLTITGVVAREQIVHYVAAFDIALQPDVVAYASPLKLFEYLIMARAIVAPNTPNICEVLQDGENAVLFDPANASAMVDAVDLICTDDALRQRISSNARETIFKGEYTWENNAKKVTRLMQTLTQQ